MDLIQKYAPIIHTGFGSGYRKQQMIDFINWCYEKGYSGFSAEGKSEPRTNDIDCWVEGYMNSLLYACEEAREKELSVWLFDEWGYPTGTAAGRTMKSHTQWRSKKLHLAMDIALEEGQSVDTAVPPHFITAAAWHVGRDIFGVPLSEDTIINPLNGRINYTATRKRERFCMVTWEYDCFRTVGIFVPNREEDAQGTLDLLNKDAVSYFISQMHESYLPLLAKYFGNTIKGFFYDEPFVSFPFPYTFDIFSEFQERLGYDIVPRLSRVMAGLSIADAQNYRDICTTRLADVFFGQMANWCHAHGLEMTGHQDLDHSISTLDSVSGHYFKNSLYNDAPGVDYIWAQIQPGFFADFPRLAGSAARIAGKEHAVSESFAATSSCLYPDYMRFCIEYQIVRGISRFFLMITDPVCENNSPDNPISGNHPISQVFTEKINRRVALTNMLAHTSRPAGRIAIYIPMDAVLRNLLNQKNPSSVSVAPYAPVWEYINQAAKLLCHMPVDFSYIWKEALRDLDIENGAFVTKFRQRIDTVIIPPCQMFDSEAASLIESFINKGGRVLFIGNQPKPLIGKGIVCPAVEDLRLCIEPDVILSHPSMISVARRTHCNGRTCYNILTSEEAPPLFTTGSCDEEGIYYDHRLCDGHRACVGMELYFLLNEDTKPAETQINFPYGGNIWMFDFDLENWVNVRQYPIQAKFEPMQLIIYAVTGKQADIMQPQVGKMIYELKNWSAKLPEGTEIKLPRLCDWREFYHKDYSGWISYKSGFEISGGGLCRIDLGKVCYAARLWIDEKEYLLPFAPYTADMYLEAGNHEIRVDVINTSANTYFGTTKAVLDNYEYSWFKTKIGTDRKYLTSGLLGPVKIYKL